MVTELEPITSKPGRVRGWLRRVRTSETGQTLVEFSMVLPLLLILIFAILDFGRAMYSWSVLSNAAREGGRTAAIGGTTTEVDAAINAAATGLDSDQLVTGDRKSVV